MGTIKLWGVIFWGWIEVQELVSVCDEKRVGFPENFEQIGHKIDLEIAARLIRCMWRALDDGNAERRERLNGFLAEEVGSLRLQHEIDGTDSDYGPALATLIEQYNLPLRHID